MSENLIEAHEVPAIEQDHPEWESVQQEELGDYNHKSFPKLPEQTEYGDMIDFEVTPEVFTKSEEKQEDIIPENMRNDTSPTYTSDEASTRSDISDPSSSSDSDVFNQPSQHEPNSDMLSGREVVSGYEHPVVIQEKGHSLDASGADNAFTFMDVGSQFSQSIAEIEALMLPIPEENELGNKKENGTLVTGTTWNVECSLSSSDTDIIATPNNFLEKSVDVMGNSLNPLVSEVHDDPKNDVKFRIRKKIQEKKLNHCRTTVTKDVAVSQPCKCPEAFDGRAVLRHMRYYVSCYASAIDYHGGSNDLKILIDRILGRAPRRRNHSLTWDALLNTLFDMRSLLEIIADALQDAANFKLSEQIKIGVRELQHITQCSTRAQSCVRRLSSHNSEL